MNSMPLFPDQIVPNIPRIVQTESIALLSYNRMGPPLRWGSRDLRFRRGAESVPLRGDLGGRAALGAAVGRGAEVVAAGGAAARTHPPDAPPGARPPEGQHDEEGRDEPV